MLRLLQCNQRIKYLLNLAKLGKKVVQLCLLDVDSRKHFQLSVASSAGGALGDLESVSYPLLISVSAYIMGKNFGLHCLGLFFFSLYICVVLKSTLDR